MKTLTLIFLISTFSFSAHCQMQTGFEKANTDLNLLYKKIVEEYKDDTTFLRCLKEAQRQWVKFRDAQLKMRFPPREDADGSMLPMCKDRYLAKLTETRIKELQEWLEGVEEGEVCTGSVRFKN